MGDAGSPLVLAVLVGACSGGGSEDGAAVGNTSVTVVPNSLPNGIPGTRYATLFVNPDQGLAYSWTVIQGRLPSGLSGIPGSGRSVSIAGTPTTAGTSNRNATRSTGGAILSD